MSSNIVTTNQQQAINDIIQSAKTPLIASVREVNIDQAFLLIDSADRDDGGRRLSAPNKFRVTKADGQFSSIQTVNLACKKVNFDWAFNNVNERNRYGAFLGAFPTIHTFNMPIGMYCLEDFAPALQTALNASVPAFGVFTVTITSRADGKRLTVSNTSAFTPSFDHASVNEDQDLWHVAGFSTQDTTFNAPISSAQLSFTRQPNLHYTRFVDVISTDLSQYSKKSETTRGSSGSFIARIYAGENMTEFLKAADIGTGPPASRRHKVQAIIPDRDLLWIPSRSFSDSISFELHDEYGDILDIGSDYPNSYPDFTMEFVTDGV